VVAVRQIPGVRWFLALGRKLASQADRCVRVTAPRQIIPGQSYLVTRRCTQRQCLLSPSRRTNENVEYCLGLAAEKTGVMLHTVCVMSNHWHGVLTDPDARLPEFLETFHKLLAKAQNALLEHWENLWSSDKTSVVLLVSEEDVLEKMAYVLANPTAAGLVKAPHEWPGVISRHFGEQRNCEMPDVFFDENGVLSDCSTLEFVRPAIFSGLSDAELEAKLATRVAALVKAAREDLQRRGVTFAGRNAVLRQPVNAIPKTVAPRRNANPRIAAKSTPERIAAIERMLAFVRAYRFAWKEWRSGNRDATFPWGTYALRVFAGVRCTSATTS
jgi:putative transposase